MIPNEHTSAIADIAVRISAMRDLPVHNVITGDKKRRECATRYMIYAYLHDNIGISSNKIGKYFNIHRRSVLRGIQTLKGWMTYHSEVKREYESIVEKLKGGD